MSQAQVLSLKLCVPWGCTVQLCLLVKNIYIKSYPSGSPRLAKLNTELSSLKVRISSVLPMGCFGAYAEPGSDHGCCGRRQASWQRGNQVLGNRDLAKEHNQDQSRN